MSFLSLTQDLLAGLASPGAGGNDFASPRRGPANASSSSSLPLSPGPEELSPGKDYRGVLRNALDAVQDAAAAAQEEEEATEGDFASESPVDRSTEAAQDGREEDEEDEETTPPAQSRRQVRRDGTLTRSNRGGSGARGNDNSTDSDGKSVEDAANESKGADTAQGTPTQQRSPARLAASAAASAAAVASPSSSRRSAPSSPRREVTRDGKEEETSIPAAAAASSSASSSSRSPRSPRLSSSSSSQEEQHRSTASTAQEPSGGFDGAGSGTFLDAAIHAIQEAEVVASSHAAAAASFTSPTRLLGPLPQSSLTSPASPGERAALHATRVLAELDAAKRLLAAADERISSPRVNELLSGGSPLPPTPPLSTRGGGSGGGAPHSARTGAGVARYGPSPNTSISSSSRPASAALSPFAHPFPEETARNLAAMEESIAAQGRYLEASKVFAFRRSPTSSSARVGKASSSPFSPSSPPPPPYPPSPSTTTATARKAAAAASGATPRATMPSSAARFSPRSAAHSSTLSSPIPTSALSAEALALASASYRASFPPSLPPLHELEGLLLLQQQQQQQRDPSTAGASASSPPRAPAYSPSSVASPRSPRKAESVRMAASASRRAAAEASASAAADAAFAAGLGIPPGANPYLNPQYAFHRVNAARDRGDVSALAALDATGGWSVPPPSSSASSSAGGVGTALPPRRSVVAAALDRLSHPYGIMGGDRSSASAGNLSSVFESVASTFQSQQQQQASGPAHAPAAEDAASVLASLCRLVGIVPSEMHTQLLPRIRELSRAAVTSATLDAFATGVCQRLGKSVLGLVVEEEGQGGQKGGEGRGSPSTFFGGPTVGLQQAHTLLDAALAELASLRKLHYILETQERNEGDVWGEGDAGQEGEAKWDFVGGEARVGAW